MQRTNEKQTKTITLKTKKKEGLRRKIQEKKEVGIAIVGSASCCYSNHPSSRNNRGTNSSHHQLLFVQSVSISLVEDGTVGITQFEGEGGKKEVTMQTSVDFKRHRVVHFLAIFPPVDTTNNNKRNSTVSF